MLVRSHGTSITGPGETAANRLREIGGEDEEGKERLRREMLDAMREDLHT